MAIAAFCFAVMVAMRVECFVRSSLHQVLARGYLGAARIDMAAAFQAEGGLVACVLPGILLQSGNADFRKRVVIIARDSLGHLADLLIDARDVARQAFYAGFFMRDHQHGVRIRYVVAPFVRRLRVRLRFVRRNVRAHGRVAHAAKTRRVVPCPKTDARQHHNRNDDTRYQRFFALLAACAYAFRRRFHGVLLLSRFK